MLQFLWYLFIILVQVTLFIMHSQLKTVWVFLPTAVVSSNFSSSFQENCVLKVLSVFMVRDLLSEVMTQSCLAIASIFHSANPTPLAFMYSSKSTLPSYIHQSHFPISCWMVAMVGLGNSVLCGKQGTWSWEGCFALALLTPDPHSPEPGGAN